MQPSPQAQNLNTHSLAEIKAIFAALQPPEADSLKGWYHGEFVGPAWLRQAAPRGLVLLGLGGWWGKVLRGDGTGVNLVYKRSQFQQRFPIRVVESSSMMDGKPCVSVQYTRDCPFPWPYVVDELRQLDDTCLLGMTMVRARLLRKLALPFLLHF